MSTTTRRRSTRTRPLLIREPYDGPPIVAEHLDALAALTAAVILAVERGHALPCGRPGDRERFTSADHRERASVARLCASCPVLTECAEVGRHEVSGVWGGQSVDKETPPKHRRRRANAEEAGDR
jgi:Transcription factor WhiB